MKNLLIFTICFVCLVCADLNLLGIKIPDFNDFPAIKKKCNKLGGKETFDALKASKDTIQTCFEDFVDVNKLKTELEESQKTSDMDEVIGKYCAKRIQLGTCFEGFINTLRLCLNDEEKKVLNTTLDVLKELGRFACYHDGDRILLFIAEGGVECVEDHAEEIKNCVHSIFKIDLNINTDSLPNLLIDKKKCDDFRRLQSCVVKELEKCTASTPANIVDTFFKFIKPSACTKKYKRSIHSLVKSIATASDFYNAPEARNQLIKELKDKYAQNAAYRGTEAFCQKSMDNTAECTQTKLAKEPFLIAPVNKFKENIKPFFESFIEKTHACSSDEANYWPQFQHEQFFSLIDSGYNNKENLNLRKYGKEFISYFHNFKKGDAKKELIKYFEELLSEDIDITDTRNTCTRFENSKTCVTEELNKRKEDFFAALTTPNNRRKLIKKIKLFM